MTKPLVSCIVIFLNAERFFEEAVESVFAQTNDSWELLLVDDGSADGSTELAKEYAERYPGRVHYLEHPGHENRGMSASRNLGVSQARGDYIAFLDADDVWLPHKLEDQLAVFRDHPEAAMTYGSLWYWHSWKAGSETGDYFSPLGEPPDTLVRPPGTVTSYLKNGFTVPGICNLLVRRAALESVGGFEDSFRGLYEDQVFYSKIGLTYPVFLSSGTFSKYRQHEDSCYTTASAQGEDNVYLVSTARGKYLDWLETYLSVRDIRDPELERVLAQQLKPYRQPVAHHIEQFRRRPFKKAEAHLIQLLNTYVPEALRAPLQNPWRRYLAARRKRLKLRRKALEQTPSDPASKAGPHGNESGGL